MESKLKLNDGDTLKQTNHRMTGPMQKISIWTYDILNKNGETVLSVLYLTGHTIIKGFV